MKIRLSEFKDRLVKGVDGLIDTYFAGSGISERLMNATVKIVVKQNVDKLDGMLELFSDKDGWVDTDMIIKEYTRAMGADKLILDIRDFVDNDVVRRVLPNKALAVKIDDLAAMFEDR
jgi:hypothetical protein